MACEAHNSISACSKLIPLSKHPHGNKNGPEEYNERLDKAAYSYVKIQRGNTIMALEESYLRLLTQAVRSNRKYSSTAAMTKPSGKRGVVGSWPRADGASVYLTKKSIPYSEGSPAVQQPTRRPPLAQCLASYMHAAVACLGRTHRLTRNSTPQTAHTPSAG